MMVSYIGSDTVEADQVSAYGTARQPASEAVIVYAQSMKIIRDQAKCLDYHRLPHFGGVYGWGSTEWAIWCTIMSSKPEPFIG